MQHPKQTAPSPIVLPGPQVGRRRRFSDDEKRRILSEAEEPGQSVSSVGRRYGLSVSLLFRWRRQLRGEARPSRPERDTALRDEVKRLREQVRELERLLGRATVEIERLRRALEAPEAPAVARDIAS